MENFMKRYEAQTYALLRMVTGLMFLFHGSRWLIGWPGGGEPFVGPWHIVYIGAPILMFGGSLVCIGFYTRWAAFLSSGLMACAYWGYYGKKAFIVPEGSTDSAIMLMLPYVNKGELATMFCFAFLFIAAHGSGIWSIDSMLKKSD
jgi:putative oxidoreductase